MYKKFEWQQTGERSVKRDANLVDTYDAIIVTLYLCDKTF